MLLDSIGVGMIFPIIPVIFTDPSSPSFLLSGSSQSMQFFVAGLVTSLFGIMQFVAAPILGEFSDHYGRKRLLLIGVAVLAFAQALFGAGILLGSLAVVLFSRVLAGLAAANFSIAQASIADISPPQDRAKNFGLMGAAFGLGFIFGPLLGGLIADLTANASAPFWVAGFLGLINLVFLWRMLPETRVTKAERQAPDIWKGIKNIRRAVSDRADRHYFLATFLHMAGFTFMTAFIGVLLVNAYGFDESAIGVYFGVVGIFVVLTQVVILRLLSNRFGEYPILLTAMPVLGITIAVFPFLGSVSLLYLSVPFVAVPHGLIIANLTALISKSVSADEQGAVLGINSSLIALTQGLIPLVAGVGSGIVGLRLPFLVGGLCLAVAWVVLYAARNEPRASLAVDRASIE